MDDDLSFGASVWGSHEYPAPAPILTATSSSTTQDSTDDFDDFGTPAETVAASGDEEGDDDFGDFGDFGEVEEGGGTSTFDDEGFNTLPTPGPSTRPPASFQPIRLTPNITLEEIRKQVDDLLGPLWADIDPSQFLDIPIREVGGLSQILITPESRQLYDQLFPPTPPELKPVNWIRSRIRRQHLIALGVPVNLDEVLPPAGGKLPPLEIRTRPISAPPGPSSAPAISRTHPAATANNSRSGTPRPGTPQTVAKNGSVTAAQLRFGPKPQLDESKISTLLNLDPSDLSLQPLKKLNAHLDAIKEQTVQTSAVLTYLLQTRDALQQDSETYNKLIGELVGEAQKIKTGKRTAGSRRGSAMT